MSLGITIVSHVYEVANGLPRLLTQVAKDVPITTAGGTEDNDVGTSMEKIMNAFEENDDDEILDFYDLGSEKMNLELAIEFTALTDHIYDVNVFNYVYNASTHI